MLRDICIDRLTAHISGMSMYDVIRRIDNVIKDVTGAIDVAVIKVNGSTIEIHLIYPGMVSLGDLLRSLTSLKKLLHSYGLKVIEPVVESPDTDLIHVVVKVIERRSSINNVI